MANEFAARTSVEQVEEGAELAPKFDADGLIPAVTTDAATRRAAMVGYMNAEALRKTIETGEAHYWSRSRQVALAQRRDERPRAEGHRAHDRRRSGLRLAQGRRGGRRELPRRLSHLLLPAHSARRKARSALEFTENEKVFDPAGRLRRRAEPDEALACRRRAALQTSPSTVRRGRHCLATASAHCHG